MEKVSKKFSSNQQFQKYLGMGAFHIISIILDGILKNCHSFLKSTDKTHKCEADNFLMKNLKKNSLICASDIFSSQKIARLDFAQLIFF